MKLSELANALAQNIQDLVRADIHAGAGAAKWFSAEPILTQKELDDNHYGRLQPGCIAIRVLIVANEELGGLGRMELFIPVNKKRLKEAPDSCLASVMRFIMQATQYRAEMIGKVRERVKA